MVKADPNYKLKPLLHQYYNIQPEITLCYRPTTKDSWGDRCIYLSEKYSPYKQYNHRSVLDCEVVIEYDTDDMKANRKYVDIIANRLSKDDISWAKHHSGNKSTHLHCLLDTKNATNISLLKNAFMREYSEGLPLPDMRLTGKHLVRAEYGIHEKTGVRKKLISRIKDYVRLNKIPDRVWERYQTMMARIVSWKTSRNLTDLANSDEVKLILDTVRFKEFRDGRERALFMLIHLLKEKYKEKRDMVAYLQEWYRYSGGHKLSDRDVENKVGYHWNRNYSIGPTYIATFLEELGHTGYADGEKKNGEE